MWNSRQIYSLYNEIRTKESIHSFPFYIGILVVLILTGMLGMVQYFDSILPTPLLLKDEPNFPNYFNAERASWDVKNLTDIGCRLVGSHENEVVTVDYLTKRIDTIINSANPSQHVELSTQIVSGSYFLGYSTGFINSYGNVQNIIAKIHGKDGANASVLVNSHFDSAPTSPGGSDDGINVAVMLEVLSRFAQNENRPLHNIVFLFNGAEEVPLEASHGFITKHEWAKDCKVVINLDAAGSGGKIILFQTGPETPWLVKYYGKVPHPYGQAAGEEIFQSGIIPSDTDFRVFRDVGGLVGLDMAFIKDGYRYHTSHDTFENIPLGSYQHAGDNVISLVKNLANCPELYENVPSEGTVVYYDVFGLFFMKYPKLFGSILNVYAITSSLIDFVYTFFSFKIGFSKQTLKFLGCALAAIIGSWVICILFVFITGVALDLLGKSMSWYANPWLVCGLYAVPVIGLSGILLFLTNHENIALGIRCQVQAHVVRLIWTLVLAVGVYFNIRAMYAIMLPVFFNSAAFFCIHLFKLDHSVKKWQIIYVIFNIFPAMNVMYQGITTLSLFIPITGRMGSSKNPELIIGFMVFFFTILIVSPLTAFTNSLRKAKYYFLTLATVFVVCIIIIFTPYGFPYSENATQPRPQRQWILHTSREFFNESKHLIKKDSGFFFLNLDRNSPRILRDHVKDLGRAVSVKEDCKVYPACGLPLSHPLMLEIADYSTWIPAGQPVLPTEQVNFTVLSKTNLSPNLIRYNVSVKGPDRLTIYLIPKQDVILHNTSLVETLYTPKHTFQERPMYFVLYQFGIGEMDFKFDFTVEVPDNWDSTTALDFVVIGRYVHDRKITRTPQFLNLLSQLPKWTDTISWLASYQAYVI